MKKAVYGLLLAAAVAAILLLTFQDAEGTMRLSEGVRLWLERHGIHSDSHSLRSNAHLVLYFALGVALSLFGRECGWKWWVILLAGCAIGLADESIKVLLPAREFDMIDLCKDWAGVTGAYCLISFFSRIIQKR